MAANDFVTVNDVKAFAPSGQGNGLDDLIQALITRESEFIQTWLNRPLLQATVTERYDGEGAHLLPLNLWPITSVQSVVVDDLVWAPATTAASTGYRNSQRFLIAINQRFTRGVQNVAVTYTGGYPKASLPDEVKQACIELVTLRLDERKRLGQTGKSLNGDSVQFDKGDMPPSIAARLTPFKTYISGSIT